MGGGGGAADAGTEEAPLPRHEPHIRTFSYSYYAELLPRRYLMRVELPGQGYPHISFSMLTIPYKNFIREMLPIRILCSRCRYPHKLSMWQ